MEFEIKYCQHNSCFHLYTDTTGILMTSLNSMYNTKKEIRVMILIALKLYYKTQPTCMVS